MDFPRTSPTSALCLSVTPFLTVLTPTHHGPFYLLWSTFVLVLFSYMCHCEVFLVSYIQKNRHLLRKIIFVNGLTFGTGVLHLIQINHQPDATIFQFIILTFVYNSKCFGYFPAHHQEFNYCSGSLWFFTFVSW
jgi:hypothetical protein